MDNTRADLERVKQLVGKKVTCRFRNDTWGGTLDSVGVNPLHNRMQVTIDRTPLWPVDLKTVKEQKPSWEKKRK